jgi:hypothetical protein
MKPVPELRARNGMQVRLNEKLTRPIKELIDSVAGAAIDLLIL